MVRVKYTLRGDAGRLRNLEGVFTTEGAGDGGGCGGFDVGRGI